MEQIAEKHKGLIAGMSKIYDTLIAMRYFSDGDVIRPPVNEQTLPFSQLQSLGYDSEVLDLVKVLPMLRPEIAWGWQDWGTELLPRSKAVTCFPLPGDPDFLNDLRWGDFYKTEDPADTKLLHPWMLKLTECGQEGWGTSLIYNTRDQTIIEWTQVGTQYWDELPSRPVEEVLSEVTKKLESLEWVPYYDLFDNEQDLFRRKLVENPIVFQNIFPGGIRTPSDITAAIEYMEREHGGADNLRKQINRWRALQMHYVDSGWGTDAWDPDAFWEKRVTWLEEEHTIQRERPDYVYDLEYRERPVSVAWIRRYSEFLKRSAGDRAV